MRTIRYREIAEDLEQRLDAGEFSAGTVLPSEADLSVTYRASRVTIRKALEALRSQGLLDARQGYGWFVPTRPVRQPLAHLGTIEAQLEAEGRHSERKILDFDVVAAPGPVAEVLGVEAVLRVRRLNLADGEPFALVTVWCPEHLGRDLSRSQLEEASFYDLLPIKLAVAVQTIGAAVADVADAELLEVPVGSPVLECRRTTSTAAGRAVLVGEYVFPAHRTEFVVDLVHLESSIAPSGLHLLERPDP